MQFFSTKHNKNNHSIGEDMSTSPGFFNENRNKTIDMSTSPGFVKESLNTIVDVSTKGEQALEDITASQKNAMRARGDSAIDSTSDKSINLQVTENLRRIFADVKNEAQASLHAISTQPSAEGPKQVSVAPSWIKKAQANEERDAHQTSPGMGY